VATRSAGSSPVAHFPALQESRRKLDLGLTWHVDEYVNLSIKITNNRATCRLAIGIRLQLRGDRLQLGGICLRTAWGLPPTTTPLATA
jgi:hypothetical protein